LFVHLSLGIVLSNFTLDLRESSPAKTCAAHVQFGLGFLQPTEIQIIPRFPLGSLPTEIATPILLKD
ncbi:MAG: hypothetical protein ACPHF4_13805, partial [Rubripirellula sp.]